MMIIGGLAAAFLAVAAERQGLESVATPLTAVRAQLGKAKGGPAGSVASTKSHVAPSFSHGAK